MEQLSSEKAPSPTKGNAKAVYALVEELGDWVSTEMIVGLTDTALLRDQTNAKLPPAKQVVNALSFLHYSGRFLKKGATGNESFKIATFKYFDFRQKQLAEKKSSIALVEYLPTLRSRAPGKRGPYKKKPTAASSTAARPPREDSAAFRQRQTHAVPASPIAKHAQMTLLEEHKSSAGSGSSGSSVLAEDVDGRGQIDGRSFLYGIIIGSTITLLTAVILAISMKTM